MRWHLALILLVACKGSDKPAPKPASKPTAAQLLTNREMVNAASAVPIGMAEGATDNFVPVIGHDHHRRLIRNTTVEELRPPPIVRHEVGEDTTDEGERLL